MRNWRVLTAIAAVVLAALAGVLVWKYTDNAKKDAEKPFQKVNVLVASKTIAAGTSFTAALDGQLITRQVKVSTDLPASVIPLTRDDNSPISDAQLKAAYGKYVASHQIVDGQAIVLSDFVSAGTLQSGMSGVLETDTRAAKEHLEIITVNLDDQHAVGGFLQPGDKVNVWLNGDIKDATGRVTANTTAYLLSGIKVVSVGATTAAPQQASTASSGANANGSTTPTTVASQNRSIIGLEVTTLQAEQIVHAVAKNTLYLSLNPPSFKNGDFKDPGEIVEFANLLRNPDGPNRPTPVLDQFLRTAAAAQAAAH